MRLRTNLGALGLVGILFAGCSSDGSSPGNSGGGSGGGSGSSTSSGSGSGSGGTGSGSGGAGSGSGSGSGSSSGGAASSSGSGSGAGSGSGSGSGSTSGGSGSSSGGAPGDDGGTGAEGPCPAGVAGHCDNGATYPTYPGFTLALVEDFPAPIDLDNDPIFTWSDGSPESGQVRFRKEQITFADGKMVITADSTCPTPAPGCIPDSPSYAEAALNQTTGMPGAMNVWSGELRTKYNNYRYGRYEARFHAPSANPGHETDPANSGNFLSSMFIFRTPKWQQWNEVDIELEPTIPTMMAFNVVDANGQQHYPAGNASPGNTSNGLPSGYKNIDTHTYAFEWTPTNITWYVDGAMVNQYAGTAADPVPTNSAKIMMNLWIFGSSAAFGDPSKNVYPFSSEYEYFRFYKSDQETTYPCSPTPSCLSSDDTDYSQNNPNETNYPN
jgi:hypothetical protein